VSTFLTTARARALRPMGTLPRPRLTIVPRAASRAPRLPFVVLVVMLLALGLVGLLVLNTSMERGTYTDGALRSQAEALTQQQQALQLRVDALQVPQRVSRQAERLGMVQNNSPAFLVLGSGKVIGTPTPGKAGDTVDIALNPPGTATLGRKLAEPLAGAHNSLASAPVAVLGRRASGHKATNAGDTLPGSADHTTGAGTKTQ
jgi:hypothetical protein